MQDVTGCYDILMGISYTSETATTTLTRDNNASLRFKTVVRSIIEDMLVPVARKCASMDQQFLSEQKVMRLLGESAEELFTLSPQEICGEYDIRYCGSAIESLANKEQNKERALQAYSLALADPAYQRDDAARLKLFKKVLAALEMSDSDDLLPMAEGTAEAALEDVLSSQAAAQMF